MSVTITEAMPELGLEVKNFKIIQECLRRHKRK